MDPTRPGEHRGPRSAFAAGRVRAAQERAGERGRARNTVAGNARDAADFVRLVSMLGLDDVLDGPGPLDNRLGRYVRQVAIAVGIPAEATGYEVSDTATAYLGLAERWLERPDRELMLAWDERLGWYVGVETIPGEAPVVVGYLGGDAVRAPAAVARFVADAVAGRPLVRVRPVLALTSRGALADRIAVLLADLGSAD